MAETAYISPHDAGALAWKAFSELIRSDAGLQFHKTMSPFREAAKQHYLETGNADYSRVVAAFLRGGSHCG